MKVRRPARPPVWPELGLPYDASNLAEHELLINYGEQLFAGQVHELARRDQGRHG